MFDDLPKNSPFKKFFGSLIFLIVLGVIGYFGYQKYIVSENTVEPKILPTKIADSSIATPSPKLSALTLSPTPTPTTTPDYKVPMGETYIASSSADTNGDGKEETLVISRQTDSLYHIYVLSADKVIVFENKNLPKQPARVSTQKYDPAETFISWILVMSENSGDLFFIHWNGTAYEIPQGSIF